MSRLLLRWMGVALLLCLLLGGGFFVWARVFAGGPVSFIPGGALSGTLVSPPPAEFAFLAEEQYVDVEVQDGWLPFSKETWFIVHEGRVHLLVLSIFATGLEERIAREPLVRIRSGDQLYEQRAELLSGSENLGALIGPLLRRTASIEVEGRVAEGDYESPLEDVGISIYRLENR